MGDFQSILDRKEPLNSSFSHKFNGSLFYGDTSVGVQRATHLNHLTPDGRLNKSIGMFFHHFAYFVKVLHVINFRHAGEFPDTLVQ